MHTLPLRPRSAILWGSSTRTLIIRSVAQRGGSAVSSGLVAGCGWLLCGKRGSDTNSVFTTVLDLVIFILLVEHKVGALPARLDVGAVHCVA